MVQDDENEHRKEIEGMHAVYGELQFDHQVRDHIIRRCLPYVQGPCVLDLGYAGDNWPEKLLATGHSVDIVEGNGTACAEARQRFEGQAVRVHHDLFESFTPSRLYDTIVAGSVIELMAEPAAFLSSLRAWMKPDGVLILTTKNRRSLHRRLGVYMGLEDSTESLNAQARATNTLHLYDRYELTSLLSAQGFQIELNTGMFLKVLPSKQIAEMEAPLINALMAVGDEMADYCKELVVIARPRTGRP